MDMMKRMIFMMMAMSMLTVIVVDSSSLVSDSCLNLTEWTVGIHSGKIDRDDVIKNVKRTVQHTQVKVLEHYFRMTDATA